MESKKLKKNIMVRVMRIWEWGRVKEVRVNDRKDERIGRGGG
jgi:hypothetical protein